MADSIQDSVPLTLDSFESEVENFILAKKKTEAPNPYIQYIQERRKQLLLLDPKKKLDMRSVNKDWAALPDVERSVFKERADNDRKQLGSNYRKGRKWKKKKEGNAGSTKNKKQDAEVGTSSSAPAEPSIEELLNRLEELDNTIEVISISNENLRSEISTINTTLAINRHILESKTESHDAFQTKYNDIVAKHGTCFKSS